MLTATDEQGHAADPDIPKWQENYVWHAWDPATRSGWNLHLGHIGHEGIVDVRGHVVVNGEVTAGSFQEPGADCYGVSGLDFDVVRPFERQRLRFEGRGRRGPDAGGWFGRGAGDVPFGFEVELVSEHRPFSSSDYSTSSLTLDAGGEHYELGARWTGRMWSGSTVVRAAGLLVRDHSWGGRDWKWDHLSWVPMAFDEGRRFVFNLCFRLDGAWHSTSVELDGDAAVVSDDMWVRLGGDPVPRRYSSADILVVGSDGVKRYAATGDIHLPVGRTHSRTGLSDMYSTVVGEDRVGFCTVQTFPTEAQVADGFADPLPQYAG